MTSGYSKEDYQKVFDFFVNDLAQYASQDLAYMKTICIELGNLIPQKEKKKRLFFHKSVNGKSDSVDSIVNRQGADDNLHMDELSDSIGFKGVDKSSTAVFDFFNSDFNANGKSLIHTDNFYFGGSEVSNNDDEGIILDRDQIAPFDQPLPRGAGDKHYANDLNANKVYNYFSQDDEKARFEFISILETSVHVLNKSAFQNISNLTASIFDKKDPSSKYKSHLSVLSNPVLVSPNDDLLDYSSNYGIQKKSSRQDGANFTYFDFDIKKTKKLESFTTFFYSLTKSFSFTRLCDSTNDEFKIYYLQYLICYFYIRYVQSKFICTLAAEMLQMDENWWSNPKIESSYKIPELKSKEYVFTKIEKCLTSLLVNTEFWLYKHHIDQVYKEIFKPLSIHAFCERKLLHGDILHLDHDNFFGNIIDSNNFSKSSFYTYVAPTVYNAKETDGKQKLYENIKLSLVNTLTLFDFVSILCTKIFNNFEVEYSKLGMISFRQALEYKITSRNDQSKLYSLKRDSLKTFLSFIDSYSPYDFLNKVMTFSDKEIVPSMDPNFLNNESNSFFLAPFLNEYNMDMHFVLFNFLYYPRLFVVTDKTNDNEKHFYHYTNSISRIGLKNKKGIETNTLWELFKSNQNGSLVYIMIQKYIYLKNNIKNDINNTMINDVFFKAHHFLNPRLIYPQTGTFSYSIPKTLIHNIYYINEKPISVSTVILPLKSVIGSFRNSTYFTGNKQILELFETKIDNDQYGFSTTREIKTPYELKLTDKVHQYYPDSYSFEFYDKTQNVTASIDFVLNGCFLSKVIAHVNNILKTDTLNDNTNEESFDSENDQSESESDAENENALSFSTAKSIKNKQNYNYEPSGKMHKLTSKTIKKIEKMAFFIETSYVILYSFSSEQTNFFNDKKDLQKLRDVVEYSRAEITKTFMNDKILLFPDTDYVPIILDTMPQTSLDFYKEMKLQLVHSNWFKSTEIPKLRSFKKDNVVMKRILKTTVHTARNNIDQNQSASYEEVEKINIFSTIEGVDQPLPFVTKEKPEKKLLTINIVASPEKYISNTTNKEYKPDSFLGSFDISVHSTESPSNVDESAKINAANYLINDKNLRLAPYYIGSYTMNFKTVPITKWDGFYNKLKKRAMSLIRKTTLSDTTKFSNIDKKDDFVYKVPLVPLKYLPLINKDMYELDPCTVGKSVFDVSSDNENNRVILYDFLEDIELEQDLDTEKFTVYSKNQRL